MQVAHPTVRREIRLSWGVWPRRKMVEGLGCEGRSGSRACGRQGGPTLSPPGHLSTFAGKPECSRPVIQTCLPLGKSTLDREVFPTALKCREEREGGSQLMASGKAICPVQDLGSLAGGTLPTLTRLPPPGAIGGCWHLLQDQTPNSCQSLDGSLGRPWAASSRREDTHALDAPEEKPAFPKSWGQRRKSQRSRHQLRVSLPRSGSAWF